MRIERIELDGFGRFHEARWPLGEGLTVLLGANEAGKTTLLNGLRALLFGFEPTRDGRTWYPALAGGRRGGRLTLLTAGGERWVVERHGEKGGSGSLTVRAPNGNQGGQETLDRLLRGADRDLYNNIFAFGLGELQTFSSLSADGVRGRIYGAGAGLGGTSAVDLERRLRQTLDATFLPRGQRPLNQLLARTEELRTEIVALARQPEEHAAAHRERNGLLRAADGLRDRLREAREAAARVDRLRAALPAVGELGAVMEELAAGDAGLDALPEDAITVLDRLVASVAESRATLRALDEELAEARFSRERVEVDGRILALADEIGGVRADLTARQAAEARRRDLEIATARASQAVEEQLERTGGWDEARLLALDDSIPSIEATRHHEERLREARATAAATEARRRTAAEELAHREREGGVDAEIDDAALDARMSAIRELDRLERESHLASAPAPRSVAGAALAAAAALGALVGWVVGAPLVGALAGILAGAAAAMWLIGRPRRSAAHPDARRRLLATLGLPPDADAESVRAAADAVSLARARREVAREQRSSLDVRRAELERRGRESRAAADAVRAVEEAWEAWLAGHRLDPGLTPEAARQLLGAAGIARRAVAERRGHRASLDEIEAADAAWQRRAGRLVVEAGGTPEPDRVRLAAQVDELVSALERAREARRRCADLDETIARLEARRGPAATAVEEREAAVGAHLERVGCADAETLRRRAVAAGERRELHAAARRLRERLAGIAGSPDGIADLVAEVSGTDAARLEALGAQRADDVARLEDEERETLNRIGALEARIAQLESAEELGARRQELASVQGQAAAMARAWAVRALALRLLEETRSRYERERQPDVVRAAESHFERITGGRYARIVAPPGEGTVRVETEGGESRITDELSRGTVEQLYLALRFGLIEQFAQHAEPLPVVMDDILVNFDADRAGRAAAAIRELAERHQVLFFTCHASTAEALDPDGRRTLALG